MSKIAEEQVYEKLRRVLDPELGVNIVDLGLVYKVELNEQKTENNEKRKKIFITMTLTSPGCPLAGSFSFLVKSAVSELEGVGEEGVDVELTFDPPWTPEMMSQECRAELGFD